MGNGLDCGCMTAIDVSPEMLALIGSGPAGDHPLPPLPVVFEIDFGDSKVPASFTFHDRVSPDCLSANQSSVRLILVVAIDACERVLGAGLNLAAGSIHFLPAELKAIAVAIRDCALPAGAATPYRLAKSIELLCDLLAAHRQGMLMEIAAPVSLSFGDTQRVVAARELIDEHWNEKLTLCEIARRCGLNRSKLARGFRELYNCTISEVLAERRLAEARKQLIATDLPVGLIGYRSGYQNNASFTRAFGRRFGVSPSDFRACGLAA